MNSVIIVLGAPNDDQGNLSEIAQSRCQEALRIHKTQPQSKLLMTGGFGAFNQTDMPHAYYCQRYLMSLGVPADTFTNIALSRFTFEDATLAKPIVEQHGFSHITLITSEFHMPRAKLIFSALFANYQLSYYATTSPVSPQKMRQLQAHELTVMDRERANISNYFA
ncbi:YdcF family protein [Shewanella fidelis]|uniref:YdcF family protein n=1 Tax=Shewanella fidelis TaxID=173509 RepID=UPI00048AB2FB|nr:YdcF family protein [Shewanella fidelis]